MNGIWRERRRLRTFDKIAERGVEHFGALIKAGGRNAVFAHGYRLALANESSVGAEILRATSPALLIADVRLRGVSGEELAHLARAMFNLSDPAVEALYDSVAMRRFVGIDLGREPLEGHRQRQQQRLEHELVIALVVRFLRKALECATELVDERSGTGMVEAFLQPDAN